MKGSNSHLLASLNHFKSSKNSVIAVVLPASAHCVDVGAGHHRTSCTDVPDSDNISDNVDGDIEVEILHPFNDEVTAEFVGICEG